VRAVWKTTFQSLRVRNYRLFALGQLVKLVGVWMMFTAQDWLVLDLSHNSPGALGVVASLQFLPVLLLTLYSGRLADRYDKRRLLIAANGAFAGTAVVFAVLVASGRVQLWHVFLFAGLLGVANAVETPVRQSFVSELVELPLLPNALALSAATFNVARISGPALAGVALAVSGTGPVFLISTVLAVAPVFSYLRMRTVDLHRSERAEGRAARVSDGLRYVRGRQDLLQPLCLMAVIGMIGFNFPVTLAALAKINFHAGPSSFGLLTTMLAVGALGGALAGSGRRGRPGAYVVLGGALLFSLLEVAVGFAPNFAVAMVVLLPAGFFSIYTAQAANHRVQMGVAPEYRGRVMALYVLVFLGTTPIGASLVGWWGEHFGVPASIWCAGLVCLAASVAALAWQLRASGDRIELRRWRLRLIAAGREEPASPPRPIGTAPPAGVAAPAGVAPPVGVAPPAGVGAPVGVAPPAGVAAATDDPGDGGAVSVPGRPDAPADRVLADHVRRTGIPVRADST
jgi:MFS family permease